MTTKNTDSVRRPHKEADHAIEHKEVSKIKEVKHNTAKEESMATHKEFSAENPFMNYAGQAQDAMKEIYGYQVKTSQTLLDQVMKWTQTYTDHVYTQVNEATRLSQEYLKSSAHIADEMRKNYHQMTEKMTK